VPEAYFRWQADTLTLFCHLQPKASKDEICGLHGDRLKIRISAPPVDGKANKHLIAYIAKQFAVPRKAVSIKSGETGRQKTLQIERPVSIPASLQTLGLVKPG